MEKLEILEQFKDKYSAMVNPDLISVKYCQTEKDAFVEMLFSANSLSPEIINLDFISETYEEENKDHLLFKPEADIVDNANCLIELDSYSLIMCIDNLFTDSAI